MTVPLILASASRPRRDLLFNAGICPEVRVSEVDEAAAVAGLAADMGVPVTEVPIELRVLFLSGRKARAVAAMYGRVAECVTRASGQQVTVRPFDSKGGAGSSVSGSASASVASVASAFPAASSAPAGSVAPVNPADPAGAADSAGLAAPADPAALAAKSNLNSRPALAPARPGPDLLAAQVEPISAASGRGRGQSLTGLAQGPFILGADSMFELDGVAYGKPHDVETARQRLALMRGQRGVLWTGHTLIDLASGREERAVSSAQVTFADFTDEEIERYLATGEPLEVAGSFTLEGFGGAFIESVTGDPHGVIGLSLPLVRTLFQRFGVSWPDLWNVSREDRQPPNPDNPEAPKDNVHQPGDGWVDCACGHRHWGLNGASGILLARRDQQTGRVSHIVLQHRAAWSAEGGTWGTPGGATADGESTLEGALRESFEEANFTPEDMDIVGSYREDHGPWAYTTVFAFERPGHQVLPRANDDESSAVCWVPVDEVTERPLLRAFGHDWPDFLTRLNDLAAHAE